MENPNKEVENKNEEKPKPQKPSSAMDKKIQRAFKRQRKAMEAQRKKQERQERIIENDIKQLQKAIRDKEAYKDLKKICTVDIPEKKDDDGNIVRAAQKYVNKYALREELKNLLILVRDKRIKDGTRKKTTGRRSQRRSHTGAVNKVLSRNEETLLKEA